MKRSDYMNADKLTNGTYDGRKGHDLHAAYFSQFVNQWTIDCVLSHIGAESLLASTDVHLNDIPLKQWDNLPMTQHIAAKAKEFGDNTSLSTKTCVYKQAARLWLEKNGDAKKYPIKYRYPVMPGDDFNWLYSYAIGANETEALENFKARNSATVCHEIYEVQS